MSESLRDQLTAAYDEHVVPAETPAAGPAAEPVDTVVEMAAPAAEAQPTAAERARDEQGKFLPKDAAAGPGKSPTPPNPAKGANIAPAAAAPVAAPKAPRPTSWKKELEPHWETLPPEVQAYIGERERQYATGVSTYKTEADRAKGITTALSEFEPLLQQSGIPTDKWIQSMGAAHRTLAMGSHQDKVAMVQQILANNRIQAQLAVQGADGQWQLLGAPAPQQQQQPQFKPEDIGNLVKRELDQRLAMKSVEEQWTAFSKGVQEGKYPQFADEGVKATMGRLLETGFAKDYSSAYDIALRMPEHAHLAPAAPQASQPQEAAERQRAEQQKVQRARSQAVSVRSSTPSAMATPNTGQKGLREQLSEAYDARMTSGGRV